ncbi:unnamed protein product [Amoebophrya sp. A120]|nr:unnamed protein product [Amoebophrya sp. A120]|eukprot:GSA120T00001804001.1
MIGSLVLVPQRGALNMSKSAYPRAPTRPAAVAALCFLCIMEGTTTSSVEALALRPAGRGESSWRPTLRSAAGGRPKAITTSDSPGVVSAGLVTGGTGAGSTSETGGTRHASPAHSSGASSAGETWKPSLRSPASSASSPAGGGAASQPALSLPGVQRKSVHRLSPTSSMTRLSSTQSGSTAPQSTPDGGSGFAGASGTTRRRWKSGTGGSGSSSTTPAGNNYPASHSRQSARSYRDAVVRGPDPSAGSGGPGSSYYPAHQVVPEPSETSAGGSSRSHSHNSSGHPDDMTTDAGGPVEIDISTGDVDLKTGASSGTSRNKPTFLVGGFTYKPTREQQKELQKEEQLNREIEELERGRQGRGPAATPEQPEVFSTPNTEFFYIGDAPAVPENRALEALKEVPPPPSSSSMETLTNSFFSVG